MEIERLTPSKESILERTLSVFPSHLKFLYEQDLASLSSEEKLKTAERLMDVAHKLGSETKRGKEYLKTIRQKGREIENEKGLEALIEAKFGEIGKAYDPITGFAKEDYLREELVREIQERIQKDELPPLTFIAVDVDKLHGLNRKYGRDTVNKGYRALGEHLAKKIEELKDKLPGECEVFAYRKGETGDEIDIVIVGFDREQAERLEIIKEPEWPKVSMGDDQVEMTATMGVAYLEDLSSEAKAKIPMALKELYKIAETRVSGLKSER